MIVTVLKRSGLFVVSFLAIFILSSCGGDTAQATPSPTVQSTPTPTVEQSTPSPTAQSTPSSDSSVVVKTASATVDGKSQTILTDAKGMTLYYFTQDTATMSACTSADGCAQAWPPLLYTGPGDPQSATKLPGTLKVVMTANGQQVTYNGHPLYTYATDQAPGDTTGQGVFNKFVATVDLKQQ
ncbi:MAG: hypothetical protein J2P36_01980 [Ktedonobacteraceae bacterium]|nr:hypothetical protein [Ktedonobacteraceae bacterium]